MAKVNVEARSRILDLQVGQRAEVERTAQIDALIENGKLVELTKKGEPKAGSDPSPAATTTSTADKGAAGEK